MIEGHRFTKKCVWDSPESDHRAVGVTHNFETPCIHVCKALGDALRNAMLKKLFPILDRHGDCNSTVFLGYDGGLALHRIQIAPELFARNRSGHGLPVHTPWAWGHRSRYPDNPENPKTPAKFYVQGKGLCQRRVDPDHFGAGQGGHLRPCRLLFGLSARGSFTGQVALPRPVGAKPREPSSHLDGTVTLSMKAP